MLKVFRDSMKYLAWILWVVIGVFVLFVFVDFGSSVPRDQRPDRAAATVGEQPISYQEFQHEYENLEQRLRDQLGSQYTPELAKQLRLPLQALDRLIQRKILLHEAQRLDLQVGDREVRDAILDIPGFRSSNGTFIGPDIYKRAVRRMGYTVESFEEAVRDDILINRLLSAITDTLVVTPEEVEQRYRDQVEKAAIRYVALPLTQLAAQVQPTSEEVEAYFEAHREDFRLPERRVADYLLVDRNEIRTSLEPTEEELSSYYQAHQDDYRQQEQIRVRHILVRTDGRDDAAAQARIQEAKKKVEAGEDFSKVAAEYSDDPSNKARGGDLGFFPRGRMVKAFDDAVFDAPVGQLIGPFRTRFGYHLAEVTDRREARQRPFDEVEPAVRNRVTSERADQLAEDKAKALRQKALGDPAAPLTGLAADDPVVTFGVTEPFGPSGAVAPLGTVPAINTAAFDLGQGELSQPVRTPAGWVLLRLKEIQEPRLPELKEVEAEVRRAAQRTKVQKVAVDRLEKARQEVAAGRDFAQVAEALGLEVQQTDPFGRGTPIPDLGVNQELENQALSLPVNAVGGPVVDQRSAVLFQVTERQQFDPAKFAQERDQLTQRLRDEQVNLLVTSLVNQRRRELGVQYDRRLLENFDLMDEVTPRT
jgi:peptidyl-prolyl cis-trans isomerase D